MATIEDTLNKYYQPKFIENVSEQYNSFENWAYKFVPQFKDKSGLVLYCQVSSVDEVKRIWDIWQKAHEK